MSIRTPERQHQMEHKRPDLFYALTALVVLLNVSYATTDLLGGHIWSAYDHLVHGAAMYLIWDLSDRLASARKRT